jgi:hypothetical protein
MTGNMRALALILTATSMIAFGSDTASARARDNPNSYYGAKGTAHRGVVNPNPSGHHTGGKKHKSN